MGGVYGPGHSKDQLGVRTCRVYAMGRLCLGKGGQCKYVQALCPEGVPSITAERRKGRVLYLWAFLGS
jgi:hypothetical protein